MRVLPEAWLRGQLIVGYLNSGAQICTRLLKQISSALLDPELLGLAVILGFALYIAALVVFRVITGTNIYTSAITAADRMMVTTCQWPGISRACSYCCRSSSVLSLYVFSTTCSSHLLQGERTVQLSPYWELELGNRTDNIPRLLSERLGNCKLYEARVRRLRGSFAVSRESQDSLLEAQIALCRYVGNVSSALPEYYPHGSIFSESLLRDVDLTQTHINIVMSNVSQDGLVEHSVADPVPRVLSTWKKKYDFVQGPSLDMTELVRNALHHVSQLRDDVQETRDRTARAQVAIMKKWPLAKRFGRWLGVLSVPPEELYDLNDASEALDGWATELLFFQGLFTVAFNNVIELGIGLIDLAASRFIADVEFALGRDGLLELQSFMDRLGSKARDVQDTISSAGMIEREESMEGEK
ncbi:MAG: hypothetical protein Q9201_002341 [Fulgogasparrea decipioides]